MDEAAGLPAAGSSTADKANADSGNHPDDVENNTKTAAPCDQAGTGEAPDQPQPAPEDDPGAPQAEEKQPTYPGDSENRDSQKEAPDAESSQDGVKSDQADGEEIPEEESAHGKAAEAEEQPDDVKAAEKEADGELPNEKEPEQDPHLSDKEKMEAKNRDPDSPEDEDPPEPEEEPQAGNSYVATIDNSALLEGTDETQEFTITFTEVGSDQIGSARVTVPGEWQLYSVISVLASNGHGWTYETNANEITIRASDANELVGFNESVAVTFSVTAVAPLTAGVYEFVTAAWTDVDNTTENNMAAGYSDPVVIVGVGVSDEAELQAMNNDLSGYYIQTADITLVEPWTPIGTDSAPFTGAFHGNGHTISGLLIDDHGDDAEYTGLFGVVSGAAESDGILHNVWLQDVGFVSGGNNVGAIAGEMREGSRLLNSYAAGGYVEGDENVGGLVGNLTGSSTIVNSYADVSVTAFDTNAGGLVGRVQGTDADDRSVISDSYAWGDVRDVSADETEGRAGGLVGYLDDYSRIMRSYSIGQVSGGNDTSGGLVGERSATSATVSGSFYNSETSGQNDDDGRGHPRTTTWLQTRSNYTGYTIPWSMAGRSGAYPLLWWQPGSDLESSSSLWFMPGTGIVPQPVPVPYPYPYPYPYPRWHDYNGYSGDYVSSYPYPASLTVRARPVVYPLRGYPYRHAVPMTGRSNYLNLVALLLIAAGLSSLLTRRPGH